MTEILLQKFTEPDGGYGLGPDAGEAIGNRSLFDDVDDYLGYSESPPQDRSGMAISDATGWRRQVTVQWADAVSLQPSAAVNTGLKQIVVTTSKTGSTGTTLTAYRSIAWTDTTPSPDDALDNAAPVAVATTNNGTSKHVGQAASFDGSTSSDADGDYLSYVWTFGDGGTASGKTVTHTYITAGTYTVTLTVYDGRGGIGISKITITAS
jgi:hypothetical protein